MKLTKLEQSGFIIETDKGFRLALDIGTRTPLEKLEGITVDAMIVSHIHPDHFSLEHIEKLSPKKLYINNECRETLGEEKLNFEIVQIVTDTKINVENIEVEIFSVDHGPNVRSPLKENFGFLFKVDGQNIYFPGDIYYPSGIDVKNLEVDYALLPVGGHYTFGPQEAFDFAKTFKKISKIIAMHDRGEPEKITEFLKLAEGTFNAE
jgi:L-ascorbate metabolism protein UlaG (beta-lactamase superfamily)